MTIYNSQGKSVSDRYDYNHDGKFDHLDVEAYIISPEKSSAKTLLKLQKEGGEVTAKDWLDLIKDGAKVDGSDILKFVEEGGKLNQEDLKALRNAGVEFLPEETRAIEVKLNIPHVSSIAPGTTVEEILVMAKSGVKIDVNDLIHLKQSDGTTPAFVDIKDLIRLMKCGNKVTGADLIEFMKTGGQVKGEHLTKFVEEGGKVTTDDIIEMTKHGMKIKDIDLQGIINTLHLKVTPEQWKAIDPIRTLAGLLDAKNV